MSDCAAVIVCRSRMLSQTSKLLVLLVGGCSSSVDASTSGNLILSVGRHHSRTGKDSLMEIHPEFCLKQCVCLVLINFSPY